MPRRTGRGAGRRSRSRRPASASSSRVRSRHARATPIAIPATSGRVLSKVCMTPAKPRLVSISGLPSRFSLGTRQSSSTKAAVSEARIPSLCSRRSSFRPGLSRSTTNDLIAPAAGAAVERGPDDDELGPVAGGDVDLLAVEHVLVAVEPRGRADRGRVRAGLGLGDRHRRPLAAEALQLLLVGHGGDRRLAEALAGHRQQQPDVAPAQLDQPEQAGHVAAVAVAARARRRWSAPFVGAAADRTGAGAAERAALVHAVDQRGEHVELLRILVLGEVVLARVGPEDLGRHLVGLADEAVRTSSGSRG